MRLSARRSAGARCVLTLLALHALPVLCGDGARAQVPEPPRAERIISPGRTIAGEDSAESISLDPANLGYQPAGELRYTGVNCPSDSYKTGCGHAFSLATPLFGGLGTGLRVDYVSTPATTPF